MIDQLLTLSREIGGDLYDFLSRDEVLSDSVSGAMIGMDRFWLESVFCEYFWPHPAYKYYAQRSCLTFESEWHLPLDYTPPTWEAHCKVMGYSQGSKPIYIRVILRNAKSLWQENKPTEFRGYPLIYEYRPTCIGLENISDFFKGAWTKITELVSQSSHISIGRANPRTAGTLGGFLKDTTSGKLYMVSCAHVLGIQGTDVYQPGPHEGKNSRVIGKVVLSQLADLTPPTLKCHVRTMSDAKRLDLAIAELRAPDILNRISIPNANHMRNIDHILPYDQVTFYGKVSGLVEAEIQEVCIWREVEIDKQLYCFGELFVITPPRPWYLNIKLAKEGDSGSWILSQSGNQINWDGMLIAGDGAHVYCSFAEFILDECKKTFPNGLSLIF